MAEQAKPMNPRANKMLNGSIPKVILEMAFPTIIAFLINSIYSLADTYFVSSIGTNATAAVSVNSSLEQIIMMAGSLMAVGANSFIARLLGAGKREKANTVLSTAFFLAFFFGTALLVVGTTFMHPMVRLLGATETCEQYAIQYATYVLLVAPFMASSFVMNQCLRAEGSAMRSMIGMGFGGVLNCFLDPLFIFGLNLGVAGASMATAISKLVSFSILLYPYITHKSMLKISLKLFRWDFGILKEIVMIGSSSMLRSLMSVVAAIVLNRIAGGISDSCLAAIGVSTKVMMFPFSIILGFGSGYQPVAGFNWGAKRYDRVRESYRFAAIMALGGSAAMALIVGIFAHPIIGFFATADAEMMAIGSLCIRLQCVALPIHAWVAMVNMLAAGLGFAKCALAISTSRQGTCFLPIIYPMTMLMGVTGVASVQAVADILTLFLGVPIIRYVKKQIDLAEQKAIEEKAAEEASVG